MEKYAWMAKLKEMLLEDNYKTNNRTMALLK